MKERKPKDEQVQKAIKGIIDRNPTYGKRRITVLVRQELKTPVNHKKMHRIIKENAW